MSVDQGMNEYFLWLRRILSLYILCWCPLVWLPGPLGIFGVASVSYFPIMILYNSIMSLLILRYTNVGRSSLVSLSLYSRSRKPGISLVALRCTFSILFRPIWFFKKGAQIWLTYSRCGLTSARVLGYRNFFRQGIQKCGESCPWWHLLFEFFQSYGPRMRDLNQ